MKTKKQETSVSVDSLLKIIDFLPDASEKPYEVVYKITYGENKEISIGSGTNYSVVREILNHSPEREKVRKEARCRLEGVYDELSYNIPKTINERAKNLRLLMRLTIIAF